MVNSSFVIFLYLSFLKNFEKILKNVISKTTRFWADIFGGNINNPMRVPSQIPITGLRSSKFWNFSISSFFLKISEKIIKNLRSRKLQGFEQSYLEAKIATPESTLTEPRHRDGNFKFCDFLYLNFLKFFLKNPKKNVVSRKLQGFEQP